MKVWQHWVFGLIAAAINGAANSIVVMAIDPTQFNFQTGLGKLGTVAGISAIMGASLYLKQSPLPKEVCYDSEGTKQ